MSDMDLIIKRLKERRTQLMFSYQDLADRTGLSKSTLQRYETGSIGAIPLDKLEILADALRVTPAYLMGWDETPPVEEKKPHTIAAHATEDLDDEDIEEIYRFIDYIKSKKKK